MALQPSVIAMENVPGAAASWDFGAFTKLLEESSYAWTAGIYNAAAWGSAQSRQRVLLVAAKKSLGQLPRLPSQATHGKDGRSFNYSTGKLARLEEDPVAMLGVTPSTARLRQTLPVSEEILGPGMPLTVGEVLSGLPSLDTAEGKVLTHVGWRHGDEMLQRMAGVEEGGQWPGAKDHYSHSYGRLHRDGLARTITRFFNNPGSGRYWHASENRALTVREAARLQGFPDEFRFPCSMTTAANLVGNALDASLSGIVYRSVRQLLE